MTTTTTPAPPVEPPAATGDDARRRRAAGAVAAFLAGFLVLNTYWGFGGRRGLAWVVGCDCAVPLALVWAQEAAIVAGIGVVLGRAGRWRPPLPAWVFGAGTWAMAATFAAVGLQNVVGDNRLQAQLLFAPMAFTLSALCVMVARRGRGG